MTNLFDMRRDFSLRQLDEKDALASPTDMFQLWLDEAIEAKVLEPNAMNLATATQDGRPSARIVLLKQIKREGFVFFSNYNSRKGQQMATNKYCALTFVWHELERQVRVEGTVERISEDESDSYFEARPTKSKLGAWASPQSQTIPNRQYIEKVVENYESQFSDKKIIRPKNWGGYIVKPNMIEFWQGRSSRLHDRIQYRLIEDVWVINRLAP